MRVYQQYDDELWEVIPSEKFWSDKITMQNGFSNDGNSYDKNFGGYLAIFNNQKYPTFGSNDAKRGNNFYVNVEGVNDFYVGLYLFSNFNIITYNLLFRLALKRQDTKLMDYVYPYTDRKMWTTTYNDTKLTDYATQRKLRNKIRPAVLKWLIDHAGELISKDSLIEDMAEEGNVPMLKWIFNTYPDYPWDYNVATFPAAIWGGNETVEYLLDLIETKNISLDRQYLLEAMTATNQLKYLQRVFDMYPGELWNYQNLAINAAGPNNLESIKWIFEYAGPGYPWNYEEILYEAYHGRGGEELDVYNWLHTLKENLPRLE
jgi:hypothetical protein